jgi:hypothetical protein
MTNDIAALVDQIDADPDLLHSESTPAVQALIGIGEPALSAVIPLLLSDRDETRLRARNVVELITMRMLGFEPGIGWRDAQGEQEWLRLWRRMGDFTESMSKEERRQSVARWTRWLDGRAEGRS